MNIYRCHYQYRLRKTQIATEDNFILATSPESARELIQQVLRVEHLEFFSYNFVCQVSGISSDIINSIGYAQFDRIKQLKKLREIKKGDEGYFPTDQERLKNERENELLSAKPMVLQQIMDKYK